MNLEVECTWNNNKNKGKVNISYLALPENFFKLNEEELKKILELEKDFMLKGPPALKELEEMYKTHPDSQYVALAYYQGLRGFELLDEAEEAFNEIKSKFPDALITKCIEAHILLEEEDIEGFEKIFNGEQVLKAAYPDRERFHFKEALLFHSCWGIYFSHSGDITKMQKHEQFIGLILNTLKAFNNPVKPQESIKEENS